MWYTNPEILYYIKNLYENGYGWKFIFKRLKSDFPNEDFNTEKNVINRFHENKYLVSKIDTYNISYEEAYDRIKSYIGKEVEIRQPKKTNENTLVISDLHIPFHNEELIVKTVEDNKDCSKLIIGGDFGDNYAVSRFQKYEDVSLKEELSVSSAIMDYFASNFSEIIIISGNHDDRVKKHFEQKVGADLLFLVNHNLLEIITVPYDNCHVVKNKYVFENGNGQADISHFYKHGKDCVVAHFEKSSVVPMKAAIGGYNWLLQWERWFKTGPMKLFLQGHTHRLSKYPIEGGSVVIGETGCMSQIQKYAIDPSAKYSAHLNGYWRVIQNNGITDINESNFIIY